MALLNLKVTVQEFSRKSGKMKKMYTNFHSHKASEVKLV